MPKTGTPGSNSAGSSCGAPSAYTLDGPPDRTIAAGLRARSRRRSSCAARSRSRRWPRGPGGRSAARTGRRSRRRGPGRAADCAESGCRTPPSLVAPRTVAPARESAAPGVTGCQIAPVISRAAPPRRPCARSAAQGRGRVLGHDRGPAPPADPPARPGSGRGSASPLFGHSAIARSAWAVIVSDGLTPRFAEIAEPSTTCSAGVAVHPVVGVDDAVSRVESPMRSRRGSARSSGC